MRFALLIVVVIAVIAVVIAMLWSPGRAGPHDATQPEATDATRARRPPRPSQDPGPDTASGEPMPGSRQSREQHGKP